MSIARRSSAMPLPPDLPHGTDCKHSEYPPHLSSPCHSQCGGGGGFVFLFFISPPSPSPQARHEGGESLRPQQSNACAWQAVTCD